MPPLHRLPPLRSYLEKKLGAPLDTAGSGPLPILATEPREAGPKRLWAIKIGNRGLVTTCARWVDSLRPVIDSLTLDELFTTFGAYELARVTLPDGVGIWGPSWRYIGDEQCFRPAEIVRPVPFTPSELASIDREIFWHCFDDEAIIGFGIVRNGGIAALSAVRSEGEGIFEIGLDVIPQAKGEGLGRAVFSAAGRWILGKGGLILAITAPWNVPSARLIRSLGLEFLLTDMAGVPGPFYVPPQPLGQPHPGAKLYNYYPDWAMNTQISPRQA